MGVVYVLAAIGAVVVLYVGILSISIALKRVEWRHKWK